MQIHKYKSLAKEGHMINRLRVIMTQRGMEHLDLPVTYGYLISKKPGCVYVLEDEKKSITKYHRDFWKAYHAEEAHIY